MASQNFPPGTFCWVELGTTDTKAAEDFYSKLLGWSANVVPMAEDQRYWLFQQGAGFSIIKLNQPQAS